MTMCNPPHPGGTIRECIEETGWSVTTAAKRLGVSREGLSRVLSGKGGVSPRLAVAMERVGWSTAAQWLRVQGSYDLAQLRPKQKQMCDRDVIIRGVQNCLDGMLKKTEGARPDQLESPAWWTTQTMTALCGWGLRKGFHVCASKMKDEADMMELAQECGGKIQGEWLNDFTCLDHHDDGWLKRIPLVAESEWNDKKDEIEKDFKRLLAVRADVRVMVFNGNRYRTDESRSSQGKTSIESGELEKFTKYITECEHTQAGDTYLLAARLHDDGGGRSVNHRFDFHRFDAPSTT